MHHVTVRVPASTSNLGPGFDCLGVALRIYNEITIARGRGERPPAMVRSAADAFFKRAPKPFPFSCAIAGQIPPSRGLGSSAAIRLGVLHGLNELAGRPLQRREIFELCARLEGHPDNAAPSCYGGFNVGRGPAHPMFFFSSPFPFFLLLPPFSITTAPTPCLLSSRIECLA